VLAFNWGVFWAIIAALALGETLQDLIRMWNSLRIEPPNKTEEALCSIRDDISKIELRSESVERDLRELNIGVLTWIDVYGKG
jgi:hypothetical protein